MYFNTPITDWSVVVTALFALTVIVPASAFALAKLVAAIEERQEKQNNT